MNETKIYLNTWGAYNNGCIGYGWMTPDEARDFIDEDPERDGGEWFIADIDDYLGIEFGKLEYQNVDDVIDTIETLENMSEWEREEIIAIMEYRGTNDVQDAIDSRDRYIIYSDADSYFESCDECLEFNGNDILERYFDYDAFHRDCMFDAYEAGNGVVIVE